jgi:hypothetical protein
MPYDPPHPVCGSDPRVMCAERRRALRAGEMFYSSHHLGWIYPAEERAVPKSLTSKGHAPFLWRWCPFCTEPLPDVTTQVRDLLDDSGEATDGSEAA